MTDPFEHALEILAELRDLDAHEQRLVADARAHLRAIEAAPALTHGLDLPSREAPKPIPAPTSFRALASELKVRPCQ